MRRGGSGGITWIWLQTSKNVDDVRFETRDWQKSFDPGQQAWGDAEVRQSCWYSCSWGGFGETGGERSSLFHINPFFTAQESDSVSTAAGWCVGIHNATAKLFGLRPRVSRIALLSDESWTNRNYECQQGHKWGAIVEAFVRHVGREKERGLLSLSSLHSAASISAHNPLYPRWLMQQEPTCRHNVPQLTGHLCKRVKRSAIVI